MPPPPILPLTSSSLVLDRRLSSVAYTSDQLSLLRCFVPYLMYSKTSAAEAKMLTSLQRPLNVYFG